MNDQAAAGPFAGIKAKFPVHFQVDSGSVTFSWRHGFGVKWKKSLEKNIRPEVDILKLIIKLIEKLMEEKSDSSDVKEGEEIKGETQESKEERKKDESKKPDVISVPTWGMYDEKLR